MLSARLHRLTASVLLAASLYAAGIPLFAAGHFDFVDIACGDEALATGAGARVRTPGSDAADGHCTVCHLQRALRQALVSSPAAIQAVSLDTAAPIRVLGRQSADRFSHVPPRAPPSV